MTITIVGAGMAGLLAANMLHRLKPQVIEAQPSLPNNHHSVLRFGSVRVSEVLGIPFKKVKMIKTYLPYNNRVADCLLYSAKCTGIARSDRSIIGETFAADRWIAPPDFITKMAENAGEIEFRKSCDFSARVLNYAATEMPLISTIPMPALMRELGYPSFPKFKYVHGASLRAVIPDCEAYVSLYIPDPAYEFNRISITGNELIVEYAFPEGMPEGFIEDAVPYGDLESICQILSLGKEKLQNISVKEQTYAKIQPIEEKERRRFLAWATDNYNVFSLGRYATWRPGLQLDDLVQDIRLIERWINDRYDMRFKR